MRLRLLGLLMALLFSVQTQAQQYGLEVEVVSEFASGPSSVPWV